MTPRVAWPARGGGGARGDRPRWSLRVVPAGWGVLPVALGVGAVGVRSENTWLMLVACAVVAPLIVSFALRPGPFQISISCPVRATAGQTVEQVIRVHNPGGRSTPAAAGRHGLEGFAGVDLAVPALPPGAVAEFVVARPALRRGVCTWQEAELRTSAPFGLVTRRTRLRGTVRIVVHPRPAEPAPVTTLGGGEQPAGRAGHATQELHDLREWRRGDELRHVHWRATARHGQLVVARPEDTREPRLAVIVHGSPRDPQWERLLSVAAWTAVDAVRRGHTVRLAAGAAPQLTGTDSQGVLDWFAELGDVPPPAGDLLASALAWTGGQGVVIVAATAPAAGPVGVEAHRLWHLGPDGRVSGG